MGKNFMLWRFLFEVSERSGCDYKYQGDDLAV